MQRYYFHTADGSRDRDEVGTELDGHVAAKVEAIKFAGLCLADDPAALFDSHGFRVEVTDADGSLLFTVMTMAVDAPAAGTMPKSPKG
jgi:hypothetical protein